MSSVPPNFGPGGGAPPPIPPYDPKAQQHYYREQQKAAWRAQREAWKAQQRAMKLNYKQVYGHSVPSLVAPVLLIGIGVVALMLVTGRLDSTLFWIWYGRWWPLLLIGAGLLMLGEWAWDMRRKTPVRRRGGFIGILILLAIVGVCAGGFEKGWGVHFFGDQDDDFSSFFGFAAQQSDRPTMTEAVPANATVEIQDPRGDVSVTVSEQPSIEVKAHEFAYSSSDDDANKIFDAVAPHITVNGNAVTVTSASNRKGRADLAIIVPKTARVTINAGKGDVSAAGLGAGLQLTARGDVALSNLTGPVEVRFNGRHDFAAHQVQGDLTLSGDCNDVTISEIKGKVTQNGDLLGDVHMETVSGPVHLHTSVTNLEVGELAGDMTLDSESLRVNDAKGQVRVSTHEKDIELNQILGDTYVENHRGRVAVEPAGKFSVTVQNSEGGIEVSLPSNASATVDGRTRNGQIMNEFGLSVSGDVVKTVTGKIGAGEARISLNTENGDLNIKKGGAAQTSMSPMNTPPTMRNMPNPPNPPHLKAQKGLPEQPVAQ